MFCWILIEPGDQRHERKETLSELTIEEKRNDPKCRIRNSRSKDSMEIMKLSRKACFPKFSTNKQPLYICQALITIIIDKERPFLYLFPTPQRKEKNNLGSS